MTDITYNPQSNEFAGVLRPSEGSLPQVMWHVTDRCPLSCGYCFATKTGKDFAVENLEETLVILKLLGVQKLDIAGGEPLMFPDLALLVERAACAGFALTITTSGAGLDSNRDWLVANAHFFSRVIVSIDGPSAAAHDHLRGKAGTFEQAAILSSRVRASNACPVRINTVVVQPTLDGNGVRSFVKLVSELCPAEWCLIQPHLANRKSNFEIYSVGIKEFESFVDTVRMVSQEENLGVGRLISRTASQYSGYWVLYPDGILRRHTDGPEDYPELPLSRGAIQAIKSAIAEYGVIVPLEA